MASRSATAHADGTRPWVSAGGSIPGVFGIDLILLHAPSVWDHADSWILLGGLSASYFQAAV